MVAEDGPVATAHIGAVDFVLVFMVCRSLGPAKRLRLTAACEN
jgi:hypothetical protein